MDTTRDRRFTLGELARQLDAELQGPSDTVITGVSGIEAANADQLTFLANPRYVGAAKKTRAGAILISPEMGALYVPTLRVRDPYLAFARAVALFHKELYYAPGIHPTAVIAETARISNGVHIGAYAVVMEGVEIGEGAVLLPHCVVYPGVRTGRNLMMHAHAVIRENCTLGDDVTLQSGAIVGGDGFGFAKQADGRWLKIPQSGTVTLEDAVEVQSNACVDRASVGETRIGVGTKIDNLVQVGHGSTVGQHTLLCAQVGLAGSTRVGNHVVLAGQVGVAGHCSIGDGVIATAQSGIPGDVEAGMTVSGYPAVENRRWLKSVAAANRLPELLRNLKKKR
jgi:UDP-3-O-[3-hydroxymyristoyl] glucosamine N-acyltransferase